MVKRILDSFQIYKGEYDILVGLTWSPNILGLTMSAEQPADARTGAISQHWPTSIFVLSRASKSLNDKWIEVGTIEL